MSDKEDKESTNSLKGMDAKDIAKALLKLNAHHSLHSVHIKYDIISDEPNDYEKLKIGWGAKDLAKSFQENLTRTSFNKAPEGGLAKRLQRIHTLTSLDLSSNKISPESDKELLDLDTEGNSNFTL